MRLSFLVVFTRAVIQNNGATAVDLGSLGNFYDRRTQKRWGRGGKRRRSRFWRRGGYRIVDVNVRPLGGMARGEIDVIAWDGEFLVFCEVKTRRVAGGQSGNACRGGALWQKQKQLTRLALAYLAKHDLDDVPCRFDVVEVVRRPPAPARLTLLRDAFSPMDG